MPREPARPLAGRPVPEAPTAAFFAAFLGGILVIVEALFVLAGGTEPFPLGIVITASQSAELGGIGVACGGAIVAVAFGLQENRPHRLAEGAVLLGLGALSAASGGGFGLGLAGTVAAGLIAILRPPATV